MIMNILPKAVNAARIKPPAAAIPAIIFVSCAEAASLVPWLVTRREGLFVGTELDAPNHWPVDETNICHKVQILVPCHTLVDEYQRSSAVNRVSFPKF